MSVITGRLTLGFVFLASVVARPFAEAEPAHEEGGKLEYLADHLSSSPFDYDALNLELIDELRLVDDSELQRQLETPVGPLATADLFVSGQYAYLGSFADAVHVVDISRPDRLDLVAEVATSGPAVDVKIEGDMAVVGVQKPGAQFGLLILDVSDPTDPQVAGEISHPSWQGVHNLFLAEGRAYLAPISDTEAVRGVVIVDVTEPTQPSITGNWINRHPSFSNRIHDVFVADGIAYVSDFFSGLVLLDLADPDNPVTLSSLHFDEGIHSAWGHDDYVYCNQEFGGPLRLLHAVDATDPAAPELVRSFRANLSRESEVIGPHNPHVRGHWLYWAYYDAGLRVFDISRPEHPVEVAYHPSTLAWGAHPHTDGFVYVADSRDGLRSMRFNEPAFAVRDIRPVEPARVGATAHFEVAIEPLPDRRDERIVQVGLSVSFSDDPTVIELRDDDGLFVGAFPVPEHTVAGAYPLCTWVEDDGGAIYPLRGMLEVHPPDFPTAITEEDGVTLQDQSELLQNYPNPFNSDTIIGFRLAQPATVDLGIYNMASQRLATIVDGERQAGHHLVSWNGRADDERPLASGVYLYRLDTDGTHQLKKLILIR